MKSSPLPPKSLSGPPPPEDRVIAVLAFDDVRPTAGGNKIVAISGDHMLRPAADGDRVGLVRAEDDSGSCSSWADGWIEEFYFMVVSRPADHCAPAGRAEMEGRALARRPVSCPIRR